MPVQDVSDEVRVTYQPRTDLLYLGKRVCNSQVQSQQLSDGLCLAYDSK